MREKQAEQRQDLENAQQAIVDGRDASELALEGRELMDCGDE